MHHINNKNNHIMSRTTIARRYDVRNYTDQEKQELIGHLLAKTQPQRRMFLGKLDGFKDKEDEAYNKKMYRAYLRGDKIFFHGTIQKEVKKQKFDKEKGEYVLTEEGTGVFIDVPKPNLVKQIYFFN